MEGHHSGSEEVAFILAILTNRHTEYRLKVQGEAHSRETTEFLSYADKRNWYFYISGHVSICPL